jgi:hypothetical protein
MYVFFLEWAHHDDGARGRRGVDRGEIIEIENRWTQTWQKGGVSGAGRR